MKNSTKERMTTKEVKTLLIFTIGVLLVLFIVQVCGFEGKNFKFVYSGQTNAKVVTWTKSTFWDDFWGDGWHRTRTKYTINPQKANRKTLYKNKKLLLSVTNKSKSKQSASYSWQTTKGHVVSAQIKGQTKHFEVAVGYSFNYATTKTYQANVNVPPHSNVKVYSADIQVMEQYTTYTEQKEYGDGKGWHKYGSKTVKHPVIRKYNGVQLYFK